MFRNQGSSALLQLPTAPMRPAIADLAPSVWLTVGLLATHGITLQVTAPVNAQLVSGKASELIALLRCLYLQLRLKRDTKESVRDKATGEWIVYRPVGGAITILSQSAEVDDECVKQ